MINRRSRVLRLVVLLAALGAVFVASRMLLYVWEIGADGVSRRPLYPVRFVASVLGVVAVGGLVAVAFEIWGRPRYSVAIYPVLAALYLVAWWSITVHVTHGHVFSMGTR